MAATTIGAGPTGTIRGIGRAAGNGVGQLLFRNTREIRTAIAVAFAADSLTHFAQQFLLFLVIVGRARLLRPYFVMKVRAFLGQY